jgi:hypothetical protein
VAEFNVHHDGHDVQGMTLPLRHSIRHTGWRGRALRRSTAVRGVVVHGVEDSMRRAKSRRTIKPRFGAGGGKASQRIPHPCRILDQQEGVIANTVPKLVEASASVPEP